ncbi:sigma-70 family RNA polymerase sigma factor [Virgisporangium aurantiacum]|uniref:DNA-directed RNA polymerase sigma-70 factor n=1 Tax=Virgisporangium aurantiacum TaxID=175570 RepID=A0A8J3Z2K3_9ACTN|nr:sigma-70 family RNA polymerase sigma factor [Virgisporangium aurantiacum]GIJ56419.1 DNA-directed RNA polymerase sigma-70 factor [Virgisporangium aurantiacum]
MTTTDLAAEFTRQRPRLRAIAYRILGSHHDAEDAVQESWLRLQQADAGAIENLEAWLTVVVSRLSLDQVRSAASKHEDLDADLPAGSGDTGVEDEAVAADEVGAAMLVVLDALGPLERLAFVLHDIFGLSFERIAPIVERTPTAARQLASRARRRVREVDVEAERSRQREAVEAFLRASREGDFGTLLRLLDPEVELRADAEVVAAAAPYAEHGAPLLTTRARGADAVARVFAGRARETRWAEVDGLVGAAYAPDGTVQALYSVRIRNGRITRIDVMGATDVLADIPVTLH